MTLRLSAHTPRLPFMAEFDSYEDDELPDEDQDAMLRRLIEEVIQPQIEQLAQQLEELGPDHIADFDWSQLDINLPEELTQAEGQAVLFGGRDADAAQDVMQLLNEKAAEGLSMDYVLQELTDLRIQRVTDKRIGNLRLQFIHIERPENDQNSVDTPSADELQAMFERPE